MRKEQATDERPSAKLCVSHAHTFSCLVESAERNGDKIERNGAKAVDKGVVSSLAFLLPPRTIGEDAFLCPFLFQSLKLSEGPRQTNKKE